MPTQPLLVTTRLSCSESKITFKQVSSLYLSYNSYFIEQTVNLQENVDPELLTSMREGVPMQLTGVPHRKEQENDAIPKIAPKWLKYDRQVSLPFIQGVIFKTNLYLNILIQIN